MQEYHFVMKKYACEVVPRLEGNSFVTSWCLYRIKHAADGTIEKYKSQFVARGFSHIEKVDYNETFSLVD